MQPWVGQNDGGHHEQICNIITPEKRASGGAAAVTSSQEAAVSGRWEISMLLVMTSLLTGQRVSHQGSESVCLALGEHTGFMVLALNEMKCVAHEESTATLPSV